MTPVQHASLLFVAAQANPGLLTDLKAALDSLVTDIYVTGNTKTVKMASQNGATFETVENIPSPMRAYVLQLAIQCIEAGVPPTSRTFATLQ